MEIFRIDKNMDKEKAEILLTEITKLEEETFGKGAWDQKYFKEILGNTFDFFLIALNKGEFAGYGVIRCLEDADILTIAVKEEIRGQGFGRLIMNEMLSCARKAGSRLIFLEVRSGNIPAKNLYNSMGFETILTRKGYYVDPIDDALVMRYIC